MHARTRLDNFCAQLEQYSPRIFGWNNLMDIIHI
jgi:hypothetical protein